jgi:predicted alpha/beta hydrolase
MLGLGEDIPAAAGRQWMYWCLTSKYMVVDRDVEKLFLSYKETPLIAIGFSDDHLATFNSFHSMAKNIYGNLPSEVYFFDAKVPIGHFGFFYRNDITRPLWNWLLPWIVEGKALHNAPYAYRTPSRL